jgi:tetratricopeptide (TPR) repeat protein
MVAVALLFSGCAVMAWERSRVDARTAFHQERYCLAERGFKDAVVKAEALGVRDPRLAETLKEFGRFYALTQRPELVDPLWTRALAIQEEAVPTDEREIADTLFWIAELRRRTGRYADAETLHRRALAVREQILAGRDPHLLAESANALGLTLAARGEYADAERLFRRAIRLWSGVYSPQAEATGRIDLARTLAATGRHAEAAPLYASGITAVESNQGWYARPVSEILDLRFESIMSPFEVGGLPFGAPHPPFPMALGLPFALESYAITLRALGRTAEADAAMRRAAARRQELDAALAKRRAALPARLPPNCTVRRPWAARHAVSWRADPVHDGLRSAPSGSGW